MSWNYSFVDHAADIAVDIKADSLNELFIASALAWRKSISDYENIKSNSEKKFSIKEDSLEILLVSFLSELNFIFQSEIWMMNSIHSLQIVKQNNNDWNLSAELLGQNFNREKMNLKAEIKAVTYHQMEIKEQKGKFSTRIVFDI